MKSELLRILEFAQAVDKITTARKLDLAVKGMLGSFGITRFGAHRVFDPGHLARPGVLFGNIDATWERHYRSAGHVESDPAVRMLFETTRPYTWTEARQRFRSKAGETVMEEAREVMGTGDGLVIPVHEVDGSVLTASFNGPKLELGPEELPALHLLGYYYVMRGRELMGERQMGEGENRLTPRQLECLKWVSEGKTDEEIGMILSVSDRTVHNHIEAAKRALGATKRTQAAMLAYRRGWLT